jgi:hypothetical protein
MADVLERREAGEPATHEMADQLLKKQLIYDLERRGCSSLLSSLIQKPERQLVKGEDMDVEQRETLFDGEQPADSVA